MKGAERGLETCEISGSDVEGAVVVADKEVEHGIAGAHCQTLDELVDKRWDGSVANGYCIEGLQVVNKAKGAILFRDTEPAGAI